MAQGTHSPDPTHIGTGAGKADLDNGGYKPPSVRATGATAGKPGVWTPPGSNAVATLPECTTYNIAATPNTAWTSGQYVTCANGDKAAWNGSAWVAGPVAEPEPEAKATKQSAPAKADA